tara:strand:- start:519 stop:734 length:216 start_codon:yes stop_codon:yes gene_type:complete
MFLEIIILGGYGQFVWPAFIFTFLVCFSLYLQTKKELKKTEKIFLSEFKEAHPIKIKTFKDKKILSSKPIF